MSDDAKDNVIVVKGLSKAYGLINKKNVLSDASYVLPKGKCIALIGPNGAGKTTLLKSTLGIIKRNSGSVTIYGKIAYVPENACVYGYLTAKENIEFYSKMSGGTNDYSKLLTMVGLSDNNSIVKDFSKGMKKKLNIAMALSSGAQIFFMDEPFEGLDLEYSLEILGVISELKNRGYSFIISSHNFDKLEKVFDQIIILENGRIKSILKDRSFNTYVISFASDLLEVEKVLKSQNYTYDLSEHPIGKIVSDNPAEKIVTDLVSHGLKIKSVRMQTLEDVYNHELSGK